MNIAQLSEQLKDVPQGTLVGYAKNPNSVVPQFLALAEIQRRQHLQAQAPAPTGTVADDVLAQAAPPQVDPRLLQAQAMQQQAQQLPENQPGVAQLPSGMPQGMASGGIVAFAGGGMSMLDDEEDDREMAQLFPQKSSSSRFDQLLEALPSSIAGGIRGLADKGSQAIQAVKDVIPPSLEAARRVQPTTVTPRGSHKYEAAVLEEAKRQGVDPNLALHVLYKETGNLKDPESARSKAGALGVMQLMPKTAAGLGVNPSDPLDNIRGGVTYLKQMYGKYGDPRLAAAAYNAGPGNVDKALKRSGGLDTLPRETRNYIVGLASGGKVAHFAEGGDAEFNPYAMMGDLGVSQPGYTSGEGLGIGAYLKRKLMGIQDVPVAAARPTVSAKDLQAFDQAAALFEAEQRANRPAPAAPSAPVGDIDIGFGPNKFAPDAEQKVVAAAPSKADLYAEALQQSIDKQIADAEQNKKMQLGLALLGASAEGLKSGSPYFSQGIGASLSGGVNTYGALKKQEADAAKDILATRLGMYKYGSAAESAAANRALEKEYKDLALAQKERIEEANRGVRISEASQRQIMAARDDLRQYEQVKLKALQERFPVPMPKDPNYQAALQSIYNDPVYQQLFTLAGYTKPSAQNAPTGGVKQYNPKTGKVE